MIPFNKPCVLGNEKDNILKCFENQKFSGDGPFSKKCHQLLNDYFKGSQALLTTSCTDALEMAAILANIGPNDEVIMPSFTFVSTANAFALRGAKIVFVDVEPDSMNMNIDEALKAITPKTKAIVTVHYAGWSCDMFRLQKICQENKLFLIEDAAQSIGSTYQGKLLGTFGQFATLSFHETKNIQCGEGGALLINDEQFFSRAEIIREKGTNRSRFLRGQTDKYSWVDIGSSFLPSELNAAFLSTQLENVNLINQRRIAIWNRYKDNFNKMNQSQFEILNPPQECKHNAHLFGIKLKDIEERTALIDFLKDKNILAPFHYVPLHSSEAGKKYSTFSGKDVYTTKESERLVRLPLYYSLQDDEIDHICKLIRTFFNER